MTSESDDLLPCPDVSACAAAEQVVGDLPEPPFPPGRCRGMTCEFWELYDPASLVPLGPACGRVATQVIYWWDGRYAPACGQHGAQAIDPEFRDGLVAVHPIEPPIVASAGQGT